MATRDDGIILVCGYCGKTDCGSVGRGQHHWVDLDTYMDQAVASEDQVMDWNIHNDHVDDYDEDYYRSMDDGEDI